MEVLRDFRWGVEKASLDALLHTIPLRAVQKWGRWRGLLEGRKSYGAG
jgi:hypothetical protein